MRPGVEITPRKQWPSGLGKLGLNLSGRIQDGPSPGRVIGRLTDLGWGARLRSLLDGPDGEVSEEVVEAAVKVLAAWDWETRPTASAGPGLRDASGADPFDGASDWPTGPADATWASCRYSPDAPARDGGQLRVSRCRAA